MSLEKIEADIQALTKEKFAIVRQAQVEKQVSCFERGNKKKLNLWNFITRLYKPRKHLAWGIEFESV